MADAASHNTPQRLLIVMPTWLGDCVMATPTLRALRHLYPNAHITALVRDTVRPAVEGLPWVNRLCTIRTGRRGGRASGGGGRSSGGGGRRQGVVNLARHLAKGRFDTAVLLPNSFRTALLVAMAGIPRRIGYERDGRGFLLTDRLLPLRKGGGFVPVPTRDYYLGIARYLGATTTDPTMALSIGQEAQRAADELLRRAGFDPAGDRRLVVLNPGANFGDAKMWQPERFAAVADLCVQRLGAVVALSGAPKERPILDKVMAAARSSLLDLPAQGLTLELLKGVLLRSSLLITNDTGPRHMAAALGVPVVTVFGPTDPRWTEIGFERERQVMIEVFCGPCQKKKCPLDHRCMTGISPEMVFEKVAELVPPVGATA